MEEPNLPNSKISVAKGISYISAWEEGYSDKMGKPSFFHSFSRFTKPIKFLGYLPITFSKSSSGLEFSLTSVLSLVSLLGFVSVYLTAMAWFLPSDPLVQIFMYLTLLTSWVGKVIFFCQLPELISLIKLMDSVDSSLPQAEQNVTEKNTRVILGFILVMLVTSLSPQNLMSATWTASTVHNYVFHCHSMISLVCQLAIYYFICYHMCSFFDRYHSTLTSLLDQPCEEVSEKLVEDHRIVHGKLVGCIRLIDASFSPYLGFLFLSVNLRVLTECYDLFYNDRPRSRSLQAVQLIVLLMFVYYPAIVTDRFIQKNNNTSKYILKMALKPFPENVLFQLTYFLRHLKMNVAHITAAGVTHINKEILTKALSLFATFFVATLQLQPLAQRALASMRQTLIEWKSNKE